MSPPHTLYDAFAIAAPGLEPVVARELEALLGAMAGATLGAPHRASAVRAIPGGAEFTADAAMLAAVQVRLRAASRVVVRLARFRATAFHELERAARQVEWGRVLPAGGRFALRVTCRKSRLYHSDAVAERVAAAIARAVPGAAWDDAPADDDEADEAAAAIEGGVPRAAGSEAAPGASTADAQLFVVRFERDICTISADASGALLHRRGYRLAIARAPLRETLAAALLFATEWDPATPLVDPMCGSGTIAIEAALLARRLAPGRARRFAAERWPETPAGTYDVARRAAEAEAHPRVPAPIIAADRDEGAIAAARANAERAGVAADIEFRAAPLSALEPPPGAGLLLCNPPYGVRVGETAPLRDLFARLGQVARTRLPGWRVALLSADRSLDGQVRLPFADRLTTRNGGIPVHLAVAAVPATAATRPPAKG